MRQITLVDCTLRDGSYAVNFQFTAKETAVLCAALERVGCRYIEIGHGVGLGGSSPKYGIAAATDEEYLRAAAGALRSAKFGAFFIPGIGTRRDLEMARDLGMSFIRVGTNITQSEEADSFLQFAKKLGFQVSYNAMKSYLVEPDSFLARARRAVENGADSVYLVDSAGAMTPTEVRAYMERLTGDLRVPCGFHGHNNLMLAVANSLAAMDAGAQLIDCTLAGIGRGGGNAQLEIMVALCRRFDIRTGIDLFAVQDLAEEFVRPRLADTASVLPLDQVMGLAGFHSSYLPRVVAAADRHSVDPRQIILDVSDHDRLNPSQALIDEVAARQAPAELLAVPAAIQ